jgi:hypothetical protein
MDKVVNELGNMLSNLSMNQLDNVISRMERMKINKNRDNDVEDLISGMGSLTTVPDTQKLNVALEGVKQHKKRIFAKKYKSLSGRKTNLSSKQIDDIFATMNALKGDEESIDEDELMLELDQLGGKSRKKKIKHKKINVFKLIKKNKKRKKNKKK